MTGVQTCALPILAIAAQCVGAMRFVLDLLTAHLQAPDRSGQARGGKEGVRLRYADLRIKAYAARSMVYRTARLADSGANDDTESFADSSDNCIAVSDAVADAVSNADTFACGRTDSVASTDSNAGTVPHRAFLSRGA